MRKYFLTLIIFCIPHICGAQMTDTLGAMAIDAMMDREAYQQIGQMQKALGKANFQQDLSELITETQIASLNGYFDKSNLRFNGLKGVEWDVVSVAAGQYYIELKNLDYSSCFTVKNTNWGTHHIDANDNGECVQNNNTVKLFF
ncbi:MAG: hypothetical protein IJ677_02850 [Alphaproteobacteria bacterium]|nr:hypothetical protein [Alphaproteobacteria bacterium]